jgi:hypothetical protein
LICDWHDFRNRFQVELVIVTVRILWHGSIINLHLLHDNKATMCININLGFIC